MFRLVKVLEPQNNIRIEGQMRSFNIGMRQDQEGMAQISKIMRDSLYINKSLAAVRETITNACDAHLVDSVDRLVDVTLPTEENDFTFTVRDYGSGLSEDDVENVFFSFFNSTKRDCNKTTGCKGLGSKAFAAVSDTYTVKSWFGGELKTYLAVVQGSDFTANLVSVEKSDKNSGIEVSAQLEHYKGNQIVSSFFDFYATFQYFQKVNVTNSDCFDFEQRIKKVDFLEKGETAGPYDRSCAYQRGICYNINWDLPADMMVQIHENTILDIHPSREFLEDTPRNRQIVKATIDDWAKKEIVVFSQDMPPETDILNRWRYINQNRRKVEILRKFGLQINSKMIGSPTFHCKDSCKRKYHFGGWSSNSKYYRMNIGLNADQIILITKQQTISIGRQKAIENYVAENKLNVTYVLAGADAAKVEKEIEEIMKGAFKVLFRDVSDLKPVRISNGGGGNATTDGYIKVRSYTGGGDVYEKDLEDEDVYYYLLEYSSPVSSEAQDLALYLHNIENKDVVSIAKSRAKNIPEHWINIVDLIEEYKQKADQMPDWDLQLLPDCPHWLQDYRKEVFGGLEKKHINFPFRPDEIKKTDRIEKVEKILEILSEMLKKDPEVAAVHFIGQNYCYNNLVNKWAKEKISEKVEQVKNEIKY